MNAKDTVRHAINDGDERLAFIAQEIWSHPQIGLQETFAAALLAKELAEAGFKIEWGVGQMPTAFVATWGTGGPVLGFLGEYDALPGLSQTVAAAKQAVEVLGPGHGCGHNLFGTACMAAAMALKTAMPPPWATATARSSTVCVVLPTVFRGWLFGGSACCCWAGPPSMSNPITTANSPMIPFHACRAMSLSPEDPKSISRLVEGTHPVAKSRAPSMSLPANQSGTVSMPPVYPALALGASRREATPSHTGRATPNPSTPPTNRGLGCRAVRE